MGHRIIEINGQSVVATAHEKIVQALSNSVGEVKLMNTTHTYTHRIKIYTFTDVYLLSADICTESIQVLHLEMRFSASKDLGKQLFNLFLTPEKLSKAKQENNPDGLFQARPGDHSFLTETLHYSLGR